MSKIRVYELAKKLNIGSKEMVSELRSMGINVYSYQSVISLDQAEKAYNFFKKKGDNKKKVILRKRRPLKKIEEIEKKSDKIDKIPEKKDTVIDHGVKIDLEISKKNDLKSEENVEKKDIPKPESKLENKNSKIKLEDKIKKNESTPNQKKDENEIKKDNKIDKSDENQETNQISVNKNLKKVKKDKLKKYDFKPQVILQRINAKDDTIDEISDVVLKKKKIYTPKSVVNKKKEIKSTNLTKPRASYRVIKIEKSISVNELSKKLSVKSNFILKKLSNLGLELSNQDDIDIDTATLIANEYDFEVKDISKNISDLIGENFKSELKKRAPIVTVMGHVDHGKTSILDAIRKTDIANHEAGGITQHIGAYTIDFNKNKIAFLDTPGHESFSAMRSRGAKLTDIVILVVAADDGVMPQTIEAISHAKNAKVPIIVAINKIDKKNVNLNKIYTQLAEHGVQSEDWGGDTQFIKVSAIKKTGLEDLLEAVLLQAELLEIKADYKSPAEGVIIESKLDNHMGSVASVMVISGCLKKGSYIVAGQYHGKIRNMYDHNKKQIKQAGPSTPVEVVGLSAVPSAGEILYSVKDEKTAKTVVNWNKKQLEGDGVLSRTKSNIDDIFAKVTEDQKLELPIIIKADTQGSLEAILDSIADLNNEKVVSKIVHKAVGAINESDINLAISSQSVVFGFNIRSANKNILELANLEGVEIRYFKIIYDLKDSVKELMKGKLPKITKEIVTGQAKVREPIVVPKLGTIAGSIILDGKITRGSRVRLIRNESVIYDGKLGSLKRFKDDVKEVLSGFECGIGIEGYNDIKTHDIIEAYILENIEQEI
jgi:translation initiation factor IF-2